MSISRLSGGRSGLRLVTNRRQFIRRSAMAGGALALGVGPTPIGRALGQDLSGQDVNLYSSRHYDTDQQFYDEFTALTGAKVNLIEAEADELIERIKSEGDNSPADVLMTVDAGRLARAQQAELLQPVNSEVLTTRIPMHLREPGGYWFGFSRRLRVFVYSTERVDPAQLSSYESLADEVWRERLLIRSSSNIYNQSLVAALIVTHGEAAIEEWAKGVVANFARDPEGGDTDQIKAIAAGEGDLALSNHYYYVRMALSSDAEEQEAAAKTAIFIPNQAEGQRGVHANISGAGIVKTAPHPQAALAFLEYMTSDAAQKLFAESAFEFPVVENVPVHPELEKLGAFVTDPINVATYGANGQAAQLLMTRAGWL